MYSGPRYPLVKPVTANQSLRPGFRQRTSKVGFPIRISADQSLFAAPHGFSQRTTSFIACACQGIHRTPLFHLITLIINARPNQSPTPSGMQLERGTDGISQSRPLNGGRAIRIAKAKKAKATRTFHSHTAQTRYGRKDQCHTRILRALPAKPEGPEQLFSSRCQSTGNSPAYTQAAANHILYSTSIPQAGPQTQRHTSRTRLSSQTAPVRPQTGGRGRTNKPTITAGGTTKVVEPDGIEPTTSCLQSRRSPN